VCRSPEAGEFPGGVDPLRKHLSLAGNILKSNVSRLDFPYKLTFVVTYNCNYKCKTCDIWTRRPKGELTLEEIDRFFRTSNRFNWIDFTGGEPWLRKDFPDIVESALDHCRNLVVVHFPTNGYLTDQIVRGVHRILKKRPTRLIVTVSTDGDEAVNDEIRGKEGGWKRQLETYRQLHAIPGVHVVLGMTLSAWNADQYERAFAAAKAVCPWLEPRDFHMNIVHTSSHYYGNDKTEGMIAGKDELIRQVDRYRASRGVPRGPVDFLEHQYLANVGRYLESGVTPVRCHALRSSCFVDSWGNVYPCGMYDAKIASLRDHDYDLARIWNLARTRELQKEIWEYQCPQCWTPCEAYQTILGGLLGARRTPEGRSRPEAPSPAGSGLIPFPAAGSGSSGTDARSNG
jgi:MoaA/NifB/PqqE/SkfB family radical SAM enzyme